MKIVVGVNIHTLMESEREREREREMIEGNRKMGESEESYRIKHTYVYGNKY